MQNLNKINSELFVTNYLEVNDSCAEQFMETTKMM